MEKKTYLVHGRRSNKLKLKEKLIQHKKLRWLENNLSFHEVLNWFFFIQMWFLSFLHNVLSIGTHVSFGTPPCQNYGLSCGNLNVYPILLCSQWLEKIFYRLYGLPMVNYHGNIPRMDFEQLCFMLQRSC
jgi:hypothetical protein